MKTIRKCCIIAGACLLFSTGGIAGVNAQARSLSGEVVQLRHGVEIEDGTRIDEITLETGDGEMLRLRLGETGTCPGCVVEGDRVRVRTMAGDPAGETLRVRKMKVAGTGESIRFRNRSGELITTRSQRRIGESGVAGTGDRSRTRSRTPGAGSCTGTGGGARSGGGRGR